jgi:hypothetical protein
VWRPDALGDVIAERTLRLDRPGRRAGARLQWLGERESVIFANTVAAGLLARSLQNCITGLADAVDVLENTGHGAAARTTARRLRALVTSGGYTADPRRLPPSDRQPAAPPARRG